MPKQLCEIVKTLAYISLCALLLNGLARAGEFIPEARQGSFGLSLNYPGAGIRYFVSDLCVLEAKGQADGGTMVGGLRVYKHFWTADRLFLFMGVEADYIQFKGKVSRGTGAAGEVFGGFEYFIAPAITLQADFGPAYIYLKDRHESVSLNGIGYVANFSFTFYWGGSRSAKGTWLTY